MKKSCTLSNNSQPWKGKRRAVFQNSYQSNIFKVIAMLRTFFYFVAFVSFVGNRNQIPCVYRRYSDWYGYDNEEFHLQN